MKRHLVVALVIALIGGAFAAPVEAAKRKKKRPAAPVAVDTTFHIVWGGESCALSTTTDAANPEESCSDVFWGLTGDTLGAGPHLLPAIDGLPLTLDTAKTIRGKFNVQSWYFAGLGPDVMGLGQAEIELILSGTSAGEEIVVAEHTTDPYLVTPASADYVVEFEMQPAEELAGKVFDTLTLSLEVTGTQMFHGVVPADGTSTLTIGAFATP